MDDIANKTPPDWLTDTLNRSEAEIAAGRTVPLEPVLTRIRAAIARMKAKQPVGKD
jgi:predicted transcriptional regulator